MDGLPQLPGTFATRPVWLQVGTLLDGTSASPLYDAHIVYDADAIRYVGAADHPPPRELVRPGQTAPDVEAADSTLMPGLIEAHAHLFLEGGELNAERRAAHLMQRPPDLFDAARARLDRLVHLGIIGVRDAGDKDGVGLSLSKLYASGPGVRPLMPYVESPGADIHHQGRYGGFMAEPLENYPSPPECVDASVAAGADRIKIITTGIVNFKAGAVAPEPQMTADEIAQLVAAAKGHQRQTFAHASGETGIDRALAGGVDSIEHGLFIREDQLARMRDQNIAWVPTFAPLQAQVDHAAILGWDAATVSHLQRLLDQHAARLVQAHALGVPIIAGSDAGSYGVMHGLGLLYELELMERAGLPAPAVLNAATGVSANRLAYKERFGRISPGWKSRFILTRHPPLATVLNLLLPKLVVFDGAVYETEDTFEPKGL